MLLTMRAPKPIMVELDGFRAPFCVEVGAIAALGALNPSYDASGDGAQISISSATSRLGAEWVIQPEEA